MLEEPADDEEEGKGEKVGSVTVGFDETARTVRTAASSYDVLSHTFGKRASAGSVARSAALESEAGRLAPSHSSTRLGAC